MIFLRQYAVDSHELIRHSDMVYRRFSRIVRPLMTGPFPVNGIISNPRRGSDHVEEICGDD